MQAKPFQRAGLWMLLCGFGLGVALTVGGLFWSFRSVESVQPEHKAENLRRGIRTAMFGPLVGGAVMVVGLVLVVVGYQKSKGERG